MLLGGDLFHENHPSRYTTHQVLALLREFSQGDKPVKVELLSDPDEGRPEGFTSVPLRFHRLAPPRWELTGHAFLASRRSITRTTTSTSGSPSSRSTGITMTRKGPLPSAPFLPVFSCQRPSLPAEPCSSYVQAGALSAVDLLSVAGLINYFGKSDLLADEERADGSKQGLVVSPVLLRKGATKLAMYGIGNVKDQRLNKELKHGRVKMLRPEDDQDDWFNLVLVHQNRSVLIP